MEEKNRFLTFGRKSIFMANLLLGSLVALISQAIFIRAIILFRNGKHSLLYGTKILYYHYYKITLDYAFTITFFFFLNGHTHSIWKFLGQVLNVSHSCDLHHSRSNARSFNPLHWAGDQSWVTAVRFLTHCATVVTPASTITFKLQLLAFIICPGIKTHICCPPSMPREIPKHPAEAQRAWMNVKHDFESQCATNIISKAIFH